MSIRGSARIALAIPLLATGIVGMTTRSATPSTAPSPLCDAVISDTLAVGQRAAPIVARLSDDVGPSVTASLPAESNALVTDVKAGASPRTVELTVNAASALPGDWKLTVKGNLGSCSGLVTVVKANVVKK